MVELYPATRYPWMVAAFESEGRIIGDTLPRFLNLAITQID
jgi:hypothetical protein